MWSAAFAHVLGQHGLAQREVDDRLFAKA